MNRRTPVAPAKLLVFVREKRHHAFSRHMRRHRRAAGILGLAALCLSWALTYRVSQCPPDMAWGMRAMPGMEASLPDHDCMRTGVERGEGGGESSCPFALGGVPGLCALAPTVPVALALEPFVESLDGVSGPGRIEGFLITPYVTKLLRPPRA